MRERKSVVAYKNVNLAIKEVITRKRKGQFLLERKRETLPGRKKETI